MKEKEGDEIEPVPGKWALSAPVRYTCRQSEPIDYPPSISPHTEPLVHSLGSIGKNVTKPYYDGATVRRLHFRAETSAFWALITLTMQNLTYVYAIGQ